MIKSASNKISNYGFSLIEMIVTIIVLSIVAVALFGVFNLSVLRSVDPMFRVQAIAVAQGYMEEILLKSYNDPDSLPDLGGRANYDDVMDYNGLVDVGARDQFNNPLTPDLDLYTVTVTVSAATLGAGAFTEPARQVLVAVSHPQAGGNINLTGFKTNY